MLCAQTVTNEQVAMLSPSTPHLFSLQSKHPESQQLRTLQLGEFLVPARVEGMMSKTHVLSFQTMKCLKCVCA